MFQTTKQFWWCEQFGHLHTKKSSKTPFCLDLDWPWNALDGGPPGVSGHPVAGHTPPKTAKSFQPPCQRSSLISCWLMVCSTLWQLNIAIENDWQWPFIVVFPIRNSDCPNHLGKLRFFTYLNLKAIKGDDFLQINHHFQGSGEQWGRFFYYPDIIHLIINHEIPGYPIKSH